MPPVRKRARATSPDGLTGVRRTLQGYADRGVFRAFTERPPRAGRHYFRFQWLAGHPFTLTYEPRAGQVTFTNVLQYVPARSAMGADLRRLIEGRTAATLPRHRRIDPKRATPGCSRRRGALLVHVAGKRGHHAYAVNRAVNLVHEIFLHLHTYYPEYLWEHYDLPED